MKTTLSQYRFLIACLMVMFCHFIIFQGGLERFFGKYLYTYLSGVVGVILLSGLFLKPDRFAICILWLLVAPVAGSIVGYLALSIQFRFEHERVVRVSFTDWLFVSTVLVYLIARLWAISLGLLACCGIDYLVFRRDN